MLKVDKNHSFFSSYKSIILMILVLLTSLIFSFISTNLFILTFFGFLPTLVAISVDKNPSRILSQIIFIFNLLGSSHLFLDILFNADNIQQISYIIISMPHTWVIIYLSCAFGWVIYVIVPKIIYYFIYNKKFDLFHELNQELCSIHEEWGEDNINTALKEIKSKN